MENYKENQQHTEQTQPIALDYAPVDGPRDGNIYKLARSYNILCRSSTLYVLTILLLMLVTVSSLFSSLAILKMILLITFSLMSLGCMLICFISSILVLTYMRVHPVLIVLNCMTQAVPKIWIFIPPATIAYFVCKASLRKHGIKTGFAGISKNILDMLKEASERAQEKEVFLENNRVTYASSPETEIPTEPYLQSLTLDYAKVELLERNKEKIEQTIIYSNIIKFMRLLSIIFIALALGFTAPSMLKHHSISFFPLTFLLFTHIPLAGISYMMGIGLTIKLCESAEERFGRIMLLTFLLPVGAGIVISKAHDFFDQHKIEFNFIHTKQPDWLK